MTRQVSLFRLLTLPLILGTFSAGALSAATPTVQQALKLKPMQADIEYDSPSAEDTEKCEIRAEKNDETTAWVVRGPSGELLRQFVDSNSDNKIDQWRYFRSGIEVYRDVDDDYNGKADQYRWLGTAGTRWGLDDDEDGVIDSWKVISAEEVTAQVIEAVNLGDLRRFQNVLLSSSELDGLGLGQKLQEKLAARVESAASQFKKSQENRENSKDTKWLDFGALRPGTIPAGTNGATKDVTAYENVVVMAETNGKPIQIPIGTLVKVGEGWRVVDLPLANDTESSASFVFFEANPQAASPASETNLSGETQELVEALQKIDERLSSATDPSSIAQLNEQRGNMLEQLAKSATTDEDRDMWWMQFADTVGAAAQTGSYPQGTKRLQQLRDELQTSSSNKDLIAHATFVHMSADYADRLQAEDADFTAIQAQWLKQLEKFVEDFATTKDAPEAMLQLALAKEFAGDEADATRWYTKIVDDFGDSSHAQKAAGAKYRLECVGKPMTLKGRTVQGQPFDLARLKGNVVLIHYWATWCEPCKQDMEVLKKLAKDFPRKDFSIVGVNIDSRPEDVADFFQKDRPVGTHLYESGGLESRLANEMGVFTLPVMILVDQRGRVVSRQVRAAELQQEIEKLLR